MELISYLVSSIPTTEIQNFGAVYIAMPYPNSCVSRLYTQQSDININLTVVK
jgi:hypothetical protein